MDYHTIRLCLSCTKNNSYINNISNNNRYIAHIRHVNNRLPAVVPEYVFQIIFSLAKKKHISIGNFKDVFGL